MNEGTGVVVGRTSRQDVRGRFGHDLAPGLRLEPGNKSQFLLYAAHIVDGEPEAVGVAEFRLAVVLFERFRREDELMDGFGPQGVFAAIVEQVDRERSFDLDRRLAFAVVEHEAAAEPALGGLPRLVKDVVGPDVDDPIGDLRLVAAYRPLQSLGEIEAGATRERQREKGEKGEDRSENGSGHDRHGLLEISWS